MLICSLNLTVSVSAINLLKKLRTRTNSCWLAKKDLNTFIQTTCPTFENTIQQKNSFGNFSHMIESSSKIWQFVHLKKFVYRRTNLVILITPSVLVNTYLFLYELRPTDWNSNFSTICQSEGPGGINC